MENSTIYDDDSNDITSKFSVLVCGGDEALEQKIKKLQCPFTWKPTDDVYANTNDSCKKVISISETKIKGAEDDDSQTPWTEFVIKSILCYEYAKIGKIEESFHMHEECTVLIPNMPVKIGPNHVALACKIFLHFENKEYDKVNDLLKDIINVDDMESPEQASVWALRGAVFLEYGDKGMKESIPFMKHAVQLDPSCGEFHFLLGKSISRVRRFEAPCSRPCDLEIKSLESAAKMCNSPYMNCILAYSYKDVGFCCKSVSKRARNNEGTLMFQKALDIYKKTFQESNCTRAVLSRIASGLMELPKEWQDLEIAEECIKKALEKSSNDSFLNAIAGNLYFKKKDFMKAEKYFTEAVKFGNFYAVQRLLCVKVLQTPSYNPVSDIEKHLKNENFTGVQCQLTLLSLQGVYYYKKENNVKKALECWRQVLTKEPDLLKELKNPWEEKWPHTTSIHQIIIQELKKQMNIEIFDQDESNIYKEILEMYKQNFPHLVANILWM